MILLVSGGLDSYITWNYLNKPKVLFVDYGQPYIKIEFEAIKKLYSQVEYVRLDGPPSLNPNKIFVPARNLMLATIGLRYSTNIAFGGVKDEQCRDKSPKAFKMMSSVLTEFNETPVTVFSPVWHLTKSECVKYYLQHFDKELLKDTVSCYSTEICNNCESCFRRFVALAYNGIIEDNRLPKDEVICEFIRKLKVQPCNRASEIVYSLIKAGYDIKIERSDTKATVTYKDTTCIIDQELIAPL